MKNLPFTLLYIIKMYKNKCKLLCLISKKDDVCHISCYMGNIYNKRLIWLLKVLGNIIQ